MKRKEISPFAPEYEKYAIKFDTAYTNKDWASTKSLITEAEEFMKSHTAPKYAPILYCIGTSYSDLASVDVEYMTEKTHERILYYYRSCIDLLEAKELQKVEFELSVNSLKLPLFTNYAIALSKYGRYINAIRYYRKALEIENDFKMAAGSLGKTLSKYAFFVHDPGHQNYLHYFAYQYLNIAINNTGIVDKEATQSFKKTIDKYDKNYIKKFLKKPLNIPEYTFNDAREDDYRQWCLKKHLFLNPLNDLPLEHPCFAADTLKLPGILTKPQKTEPIYFGLFNQIKQEYIYARYLLFSSKLISKKIHYADKNTFLTELNNYPIYSIRIENIKTAFRSLYSIFDKIAFFINIYWDLGIKEQDINFNNIWREKIGHGKNIYAVKNLLSNENNFMIKGIKWINKDFNDKFGDSDTPAYKELKRLRNALEHRCVIVHLNYIENIIGPYDDSELIYHISENLLFNHTIELMNMIRELIIYLSLAICIKEDEKQSLLDPSKCLHIKLNNHDDKLKM